VRSTAMGAAKGGELALGGYPGWEEFREALIEHGADPKLATRE